MLVDTNFKNKSGIYCIENIVNNKKYIGSSKNIWNRLQKHFSLLRHNKHENILLQNSFNKNGENNFICYVLEYTKENSLTNREQHYVDLLKPKYNIIQDVIRNKNTPESIEKMRQTRLKGFLENKYTLGNAKEIFVYDTKGNYIKSFKSINKCCKELNIHPSSVKRVFDGLHKQCKGYVFRLEKCFVEPIELNSKGRTKKKSFTSKVKFNLVDTITNEILYFNSINECSKYFKVPYDTIRYYYKKGFYKNFKVIPAEVKPI